MTDTADDTDRRALDVARAAGVTWGGGGFAAAGAKRPPRALYGPANAMRKTCPRWGRVTVLKSA